MPISIIESLQPKHQHVLVTEHNAGAVLRPLHLLNRPFVVAFATPLFALGWLLLLGHYAIWLAAVTSIFTVPFAIHFCWRSPITLRDMLVIRLLTQITLWVHLGGVGTILLAWVAVGDVAGAQLSDSSREVVQIVGSCYFVALFAAIAFSWTIVNREAARAMPDVAAGRVNAKHGTWHEGHSSVGIANPSRALWIVWLLLALMPITAGIMQLDLSAVRNVATLIVTPLMIAALFALLPDEVRAVRLLFALLAQERVVGRRLVYADQRTVAEIRSRLPFVQYLGGKKPAVDTEST
jgi:hypothetical protein